MPILYSRLVKRLLTLNRLSKTLLIMATDYAILTLCFWASLSIRINDLFLPTNATRFLILLGPLIAVPIFYLFGLYRSMARYSGYKSILIIVIGVSTYTLLWFFAVLSSGIVEKPYDFLIINWLLTIICVGGIRVVIRGLLTEDNPNSSNVVIYGAGSAGIQLKSAMQYNSEMNIVGFIDDNPKIQGLDIEGLKVYKPSFLGSLIEKKGITQILVALPSLSRLEKNILLQSLKQYPVVIRALPDLSDLAQGRIVFSDLKQIKIEDLLKRELREPNKQLLQQDLLNKSVMVTGAGGSIGSELCREIIQQKPKLLILFDISEYALYTIERELIEINPDIRVITTIGNVLDRVGLEKIITIFKVQTVYHVAAYKHVPLVEKNTMSGVRTNIFGTLSCIQASLSGSVECFVFISTDKAVRPTNIMGATKRFAEIILQSLAKRQLIEQKQIITRISIVRFGNVLGSSGSVAPLFEEQIAKGGPVTVTDPDIIRYFMTISEAAQLVIQAGAMGSKGEVFVLDMGEQIKIKQLAEDMIRLSGMTVKNVENPDGDIEIIYTGLRPGEKLFEELLIGEDAGPTNHESIMRVKEDSLRWDSLEKYLVELEDASKEYDYLKIREVFKDTVTGFTPENRIIDNISVENSLNK